MGLLPLEFTDCLTDSPYFRENLHSHENELERTSQAIKGIIKEVKDLIVAAKALSKAQRSLANTFMNFNLECIGSSQTDDELVIAGSLKEFGRLLTAIEDERDRMLERSTEAFIDPIENFRKEHIGKAKERKKKFDKDTAKYCQSLDRYLNLSVKKNSAQFREADASLGMEQRHFYKASLEYVLLLQKVQERKKTEFVETILRFMLGWLTFYHQGHEVAKDFMSFMTDLQVRLQKTRDNFEATHAEAEQLMQKMLEKPQDPGSLNKMYTRQGYLFLLEKKPLSVLSIKHYCQYQKESRKFTMIPYSQTVGKLRILLNSNRTNPETFNLKECIRRISESIDKRFCFDLVASDKPATFTLQALSEEDYKLWIDAMDGKEPSYAQPGRSIKQEECHLDEIGFEFVRCCIEAIEERGLEDQGLYRIVGVSSKVTRLTQMALDRRRTEKLNLCNSSDWEVKTITSALKNYFRNLPEPLMTFRFHTAFLTAAKQENKAMRVNLVEDLVHQLPKENYKMLDTLIRHLQKVVQNREKNLMTVSNLGVCFGPTLLRPEEETMAAIMDIKFCNVVVEILIEHCNRIFQEAKVNHGDGMRLHEENHEGRIMHDHSSPYYSPEHYIPQDQKPYSVPYPMQESMKKRHVVSSPVNQQRNSQLPALAVFNPNWSGSSPQDTSQAVSSSSSTESLSSRSTTPYSHHSPAVSAGVRDYHPHVSVPESNVSSHPSTPTSQVVGRRARTLYACVGENSSELSFEPNQIIFDVRPSREKGWLEGRLNGRCGLIPENYVEVLP